MEINLQCMLTIYDKPFFSWEIKKQINNTTSQYLYVL